MISTLRTGQQVEQEEDAHLDIARSLRRRREYKNQCSLDLHDPAGFTKQNVNDFLLEKKIPGHML